MSAGSPVGWWCSCQAGSHSSPSARHGSPLLWVRAAWRSGWSVSGFEEAIQYSGAAGAMRTAPRPRAEIMYSVA